MCVLGLVIDRGGDVGLRSPSGESGKTGKSDFKTLIFFPIDLGETR